jgi:ATP adenylyltransferase
VEHLFTPWRREYVVDGTRSPTCVFCDLAGGDGRDLLFSTEDWFLVLNAYPYTNGHVMLVTREHVGSLGELSPRALAEMAAQLTRAEAALQRAYHPDGMNLGINFGQAGGAGIPGHLHIHLMPRWLGDTNFMSAVGNTRVVPEDLALSFERLKSALVE